ncbi:Dopamine D2-like receptor, partial [Schistosoma japonicum]
YLAVTKPIVYAKHNNMRRVQISIALVWIVSFLIAVPLVCGLNVNRYNDPTICQSFNALYIICSSLGSFYLPAIILIVVYQ